MSEHIQCLPQRCYNLHSSTMTTSIGYYLFCIDFCLLWPFVYIFVYCFKADLS